MSNNNVIAIDGEAATGKGTIAKDLAKLLGYKYLDTGAIFRVIDLHLKLAGIEENDSFSQEKLDGLNSIGFLSNGNAHLNWVDVEDHIRTPEISKLSSDFSKIIEVRSFYRNTFDRIIRGGNWVVDGRDIASVMVPDAKHKFYVVCDYDVRARRLAERDGITNDDLIFSILVDLEDRDEQDKKRELSPLTRVSDSIVIDTTFLTRKTQANMTYNLIAVEVENEGDFIDKS